MSRALLCFAALACAHIASTASAAPSSRAALGTSAAVDNAGRLWIAYAEGGGGAAHVMLRRSDDLGAHWQAPQPVTKTAEAVAADGENRPKLAFGPGAEVYVSWTSPTSERFTGDIRFARSLDAGRTWSAPMVVHRDRQLLSHRFDSLVVDAAGRVWVVWIDKRDLKQAQAAGREYAGAAVYYAYSDDRGASWQGDFKLADHGCECCRIALAADQQGRIAALWRHVFSPNERDHALAFLDPQRAAAALTRVTFDRWRIDACPHHGPSLAFAADGARHAVWFNQVKDQGRAFYGRLTDSGPTGVKTLPAGATHPDVAAAGGAVAVAWKRFDGSTTKVESWVSSDGGQSFSPGVTLQAAADSDQPRLVRSPRGILLVWRRLEGLAVENLTSAAAPKRSAIALATASSAARVATIKPFKRDTLAQIERRHAGVLFWVMLWDLECTYCMKSLRNLAQAQRARPELKIVTIATDALDAAPQLAQRLAELGVSSEAYAFAEAPPEALRYAIDPNWMGEKPRAYRYDPSGARRTINGVVGVERF